jgi:hypothetical protein
MSTLKYVLNHKYPKVDCDIFTHAYDINEEGVAQKEDIWASDSVKEWNANIKNEKDGRPLHFTGQMQCFCQNQYDLNDHKT